MTYKDIICDANNLYKAYLSSIKSSKWKESTQRFSFGYLKDIFEIRNKLLMQSLTNGSSIEFELRERGKIRPVTSITVEDRIVRHVLCDEVLFPKIKRKIIYDNGASVKDRGISFQRKRFEIHLRKFYATYGTKGWILLGDFRKFYDNIVHELAKHELLKLVENDEYVDWLLTIIFDSFKIDISSYSEDEEQEFVYGIFDKLKYRKDDKQIIKGVNKKYLYKSVNIGDQLSQNIGTYYPHRIDNYIKYVRSQKYYGRYCDDWYVINNSRKELNDILSNIRTIADELKININNKKTRFVKLNNKITFLQINYSFINGKLVKRMKGEKITKFRSKLRKLHKKVLNNEITYSNVENTFKSWMGNFYKLMSRKKRRNLIKLFEDLFDKQITIKSKKMIIQERG